MIKLLAIALVSLSLSACSSKTRACVEDEDIVACNHACGVDEDGEACAKRLELAIAVCDGTRTHPHWKTRDAACEMQRHYVHMATRKR